MLDDLTQEAREKFAALLARCEHRGAEMRPFCTIRDPFEQARLWRQSRTLGEIVKRCAELRDQGAPRIAACIEAVGPQSGRWATNAVPGFSWHQHGEAMDCFAVVHGRASWENPDPPAYSPYRAYATEAAALGLGLVRGDAVHVQLRKKEPHHIFEVARLDNMMAARFPAFAAL